jgi:hypothetical protein
MVSAATPKAEAAKDIPLVEVQAGEWKTRVVIQREVPGLDVAMEPISYTTTQCLTAKDLVPNTQGPNQKCEVFEPKRVANNLRWTLRCTDADGEVVGAGEVTFEATRYTGGARASKTPTDKNALPVALSYQLEGERVGACKP